MTSLSVREQVSPWVLPLYLYSVQKINFRTITCRQTVTFHTLNWSGLSRCMHISAAFSGRGTAA